MRNVHLEHKFEMLKVKENYTKEEVKEFLSKLTDDDFNGSNGECLLENGESFLDWSMKKMGLYENDIKGFIKFVLANAYGEGYYEQVLIKITQVDSFIIVSMALATID